MSKVPLMHATGDNIMTTTSAMDEEEQVSPKTLDGEREKVTKFIPGRYRLKGETPGSKLKDTWTWYTRAVYSFWKDGRFEFHYEANYQSSCSSTDDAAYEYYGKWRLSDGGAKVLVELQESPPESKAGTVTQWKAELQNEYEVGLEGKLVLFELEGYEFFPCL